MSAFYRLHLIYLVGMLMCMLSWMLFRHSDEAIVPLRYGDLNELALC